MPRLVLPLAFPRWAAAFLGLFLSFAALAQPALVRIMPMGDSITRGSSVPGGYRNKLYQLLTAAGYNVDFVGTQTDNGVATLPDLDHQGHGGWRIDQHDANVAGWFAAIAGPDVILLHIGTNDFGQGVDTANAINRLDALITKVALLRPYAHIIVTNLMERGEPHNTNIQNLFNPFVEARVAAQAALGRRVTFLDMRSAVPLAEMPDNLHPGQAGYDHMADAWLPAIQAVIGPEGDTVPPALARVVGSTDHTKVYLTFSKPVADTSAQLANYAVSGGLPILSATLDSSKRIVTLTTGTQALGASYTLTVNGIQDRTAAALALQANTTATFFGATPRGYLNNVPESAGYTLAYSLDIPTLASYGSAAPAYAVDNRNGIGPFTRVAYYLELQRDDGDLQYAWASVDAFTDDIEKIAVPTAASGAVFQQVVTAMNVVSNVPGLTTGSGLTGNIEFWPNSYSAPNATVPTADAATFDFGDTRSATGTYGSMQLHHTAAGQTVFAFNNWGATNGLQGDADLGIGNDPAPVTGGKDWTFHHNAATYTVKTLQVLVQTTGDVTGPSLVSATASFGGSLVTTRFSEPLSAASVKAENFSLNAGVAILGVTLAPNRRDVQILTTTQPPGAPLTLTVSGLRDNSPSANLIVPGSSVAVSSPVLPPEIVANVGAAAVGYQLVASVNLPVTGNLNASSAAYTLDDRAAVGTFNRVAYYLETQKAGQPAQFVWTSMDAFTASRQKLGLPTLATGAVFQQNVANLSVLSNVAGIINGDTATGGNIEFWPNSYSAANALAVPNASATVNDTGDTRTTSATTGYGTMQVHNHDTAANQTLFAINHFGQDGSTLDIGIGNNPSAGTTGTGGTQAPDWTFTANAASYTRRVLHVLVLPGFTTDPALIAKVPEAANYQQAYSLNVPTTGNLVSGVGFTAYAVNNSADLGGFSRVAYYMELQKTGDAEPRYVWTSMDAFTTNAARIAVPTPASGAVFQQNVSNLNVFSNVAGVVTGTGISTGNIEFWPNSYTQPNGAGVPGASASTYDFGDTRSTTGSHGTMQVHNYGAAQTLFALNNWGTAANSALVLSLGIGNNPTAGQSPDYTQSNNGTSWDVRRVLQVYVLPANADTTGPTVTRATGSTTLNRLGVTFSEPVADSSAAVANFSIPGLTITGATLLAGQREIALITSAQTPGNVYTVNVTGVRDRTPAGNPVLPDASATFTAFTPPPLLATIPEATGYNLVYQLAIPSATPLWNLNPIPYAVDEARYGAQAFDRVAYLLELDGNWAFVSFDRHTGLVSQVGVPTLGVSATAFQQKVTNLTVASNVSGIVTGNNLTGGNIEFWGGNYSGANALGLPGASATLNDFGDTMSVGGHGCLQVHNHEAGQTILAYNNWGSTAGQISALGLGNNPNAGTTGVPSGTQGTDWTFAGNAGAFTTRNLYVLVRPATTTSGPAPELLSQPLTRRVDLDGTTTLAISVKGSGPFSYQWRFNGQPLSGETNPWLVLTSSALNQSGPYDVVVTSPTFASVTSQPATLTVNTPQETWRRLNFGSLDATGAAADTANPDGDSLGNLLEFAFGTDPASAVSGSSSLAFAGDVLNRPGMPVLSPALPADQAVFVRRKNRSAAGITYTVQFSADLISWETSAETPAVLASDSDLEAVAVPFPATLGNGRKPQFFRVQVGAP